MEPLLRPYEGAAMSLPPGDRGLVQVLEEVSKLQVDAPAFVRDLSGKALPCQPPGELHIHGSYLVRREDVLLFGPSNLISREGHWSCEARQFREQYLNYYQAAYYDTAFPGAKPKLRGQTELHRLVLSHIDEVEQLYGPVFLATSLEPTNWGRWIATVLPKIAQYRAYGAGREFLCHAGQPWQRAFLHKLGVPDEALRPHAPGRTYLCRDVMTVELSAADMSVSAWEQENLRRVAGAHAAPGDYPRRLFVSRLSRARLYPHYRVLKNEEDLAGRLRARGFVTVEPEQYPLEVQIGMFGAADEIVFVGGSGLYNAAFCKPGTKVVTIESTNIFIGTHMNLLASLGMRYGVIFGAEDPEDKALDHKNWRVDLRAALQAIDGFFAG